MAKEKLELGVKSLEELHGEVASMERELQTMKFEHAVKGLANPMEIRHLRRDIARIHTELRTRDVALMTPEQLELRSKLRARRKR